MEILKKFLWQILTFIACIGLFILLISAFSDRISPLSNSYIPYFGLFFPFIFVFNVLFFIFWIIFRKWKQAGITLAVFIICSGAILIYFPIHSPTKKLPENSVKVLTYNVMRFDQQKKHSKENPNPILQYIIDQDADIICLQEFGNNTKNDKLLTKSNVVGALKATPYHHIEFSKTNAIGLAVFSKYPILSVKRIPIESEFNGALIAELDVNGKKLTLINVHLESNRISADERADYYNLTKDPDAQKLEAFTYMMFERLTPAFKIRAEQAALIADVIKDNPNPYLIVCGDFNDTPISYATHTIRKNLKDAFVSSGSGMGITFNRYRFLFRIDNIFHSKNMKSYNATVGTLRNSDHYPLWTYLEFLE
jgi:endonuclease/exonuclease/phosphatase family metal-dependent hydrolase